MGGKPPEPPIGVYYVKNILSIIKYFLFFIFNVSDILSGGEGMRMPTGGEGMRSEGVSPYLICSTTKLTVGFVKVIVPSAPAHTVA